MKNTVAEIRLSYLCITVKNVLTSRSLKIKESTIIREISTSLRGAQRRSNRSAAELNGVNPEKRTEKK
jgi:hypothetical protein